MKHFKSSWSQHRKLSNPNVYSTPVLTPYKHWQIQAKETTRWQGDTTSQAGRLGWAPRGMYLVTSSSDNQLRRWDWGKFWSEGQKRIDRCMSPHHPGHHGKITDFLYKVGGTKLPEWVMLRGFLGSTRTELWGEQKNKKRKAPENRFWRKFLRDEWSLWSFPASRLVGPSHLLKDVSLLTAWTAIKCKSTGLEWKIWVGKDHCGVWPRRKPDQEGKRLNSGRR